MAATSKKTKLSHIARCIVERYQKDVKGHEAFLTHEMRFALLTQAMYGLMVTRYNPGECRNEEAGEYVKAMGECISHLWPEGE